MNGAGGGQFLCVDAQDVNEREQTDNDVVVPHPPPR